MKPKVPPMLLAAFLVSGSAGLIYQVVWMRSLTLLFGATTYAVSTVLACFMGGLAFGAYLAGRLGGRAKDPGRLYALLELCIALAGSISIPVLSHLPAVVARISPRELEGIPDIALRALMAVACLLVPTLLMGATLPILIRQVAKSREVAAGSSALLYTVNTAGAALGAALAGFVLIPLLGMRGAISVAAVMNLLAALFGYLATRGSVERSAAASSELRLSAVQARWHGFALLMGLFGFGMEVLWTRILVLHLGSSVYAYASMLTVYLIGLALGSILAVRSMASGLSPVAMLATTQILLVADLPLFVFQQTRLPDHLLALQRLLGAPSYAVFATASFLTIIEVLLLPTILIGATFPLLLGLVTRSARSAPADAGLLYAFNVVGAILGAVGAPYLLIPPLGVQGALTALTVVNLGLFLVATLSFSIRPGHRLTALLCGLMIAFFAYGVTPKQALLRSAWVFRDQAGKRRLLHIDEDVDATVSVELVGPRGRQWRSLSVNGVNVAGTSPDLVAIQALQGHLPLLFAKQRKRVLHIGFGSGGTAYAVSLHPVTSITVAELSMGVIRTSDRWFRGINHGVLRDPRLHLVHKDGRNYLLGKGLPFDVILSDSVHPRYSGNGALYTEEYYRRCRSQLREGGVISQWLPTYSLTTSNFQSIIRAFTNIFPHASLWYVNSTVNPFTIVIGHKDSFRVDVKKLSSRMGEPAVKASLARAGVPDVISLLDYFVMADERLRRFAGQAPSHHDDLPSIEYESMRVMVREATWYQTLARLIAMREPVTPYLATPPSPAFKDKLDLYYQATSVALPGHLAILGGQVKEAREAFEKAHRMNPADRDPVVF